MDLSAYISLLSAPKPKPNQYAEQKVDVEYANDQNLSRTPKESGHHWYGIACCPEKPANLPRPRDGENLEVDQIYVQQLQGHEAAKHFNKRIMACV